MESFVAFDFETSYGHIPCSIGIVEFLNGEPISEYYSLIRPIDLKFSPINSRINGINVEDVINEREFDEIWDEIERYFVDKIVVAHNAATDLSILEKTLKYYGLAQPDFRPFCTLGLSRTKFSLQNYKLSTVAHHLNIEQINYHNALDDAYVCGKVFSIIKEDAFEFTFSSSKRIRIKKKKDFLTDIIKCSTLLVGKTFLFTGALTQFTREEAQKLVEQNGGKNVSGVSKNLNYLIAGEKAGSKLKKAEALGTVKILTEEEFLEMINS